MLQPRSRQGFTLVEMVVVVGVIALVGVLVVPAIGTVTRAKLRQSARILASRIRSVYDSAALSGQNHRLVFVAGEGRVKVEATEAILAFDPSSNTLVDAGKAAQEARDLMGSAEELDALMAASDPSPGGDDGSAGVNFLAAALMGGAGSSGGVSAGFQEVDTFSLSEDVRFLDLWVSGMSAPVREGEVYLYFFPHGYTQKAVVHIEDDEGRVFAVKISALTGKTEVVDHYVDKRED